MQATQRPAVVLLHASASNAGQWDALVERLQPRFRPIAVNLRGENDVALVGQTLERLGGAHVIGHSYGGAVAMMVASSRRASYVKSLAVFEPVLFRALLADPPSGPHVQAALAVAETMRLLVSRGDREGAAQRFIDFWAGAEVWRHVSRARQVAIAARMEEVVGNFDTLFDTPFDAPAFSRFRRPALFLAGERTVPTAHRISLLLSNAFPAATHEVLPDMGHMGPVTHPELFNQRIEQFLNHPDNQRKDHGPDRQGSTRHIA